jgi:hypothetical protein
VGPIGPVAPVLTAVPGIPTGPVYPVGPVGPIGPVGPFWPAQPPNSALFCFTWVTLDELINFIKFYKINAYKKLDIVYPMDNFIAYLDAQKEKTTVDYFTIIQTINTHYQSWQNTHIVDLALPPPPQPLDTIHSKKTIDVSLNTIGDILRVIDENPYDSSPGKPFKVLTLIGSEIALQ